METSQIAIVGNHLPRKCGIATFTTDLCDSLVALRGDDACFTVAISDSDQSYAYPERVRFEIREGDPSSYRRAADFLNFQQMSRRSVCSTNSASLVAHPEATSFVCSAKCARQSRPCTRCCANRPRLSVRCGSGAPV